MLRRLRLTSLLYDRHRTDANHDQLVAAARAVGRDYVEAHEKKRRSYHGWQQEQHRKRAKKGLCITCGKVAARPERMTCPKCAERAAAGSARYRRSLEEE